MLRIGRTTLGAALALCAGFFVLSGVALVSYRQAFAGRVLPGVFVGTLPVGGLTKSELQEFFKARQKTLQNMSPELAVALPDGQETVVFLPARSASLTPLFAFDADVAADAIVSYGKEGGLWQWFFAPLASRFQKPRIMIPNIEISKDVAPFLASRLSVFERPESDAGILITAVRPLAYSIQSETAGVRFDYVDIEERMRTAWGQLMPANFRVRPGITEPRVRTADIEAALRDLPALLGDRSIALSAQDSVSIVTTTWRVTPERLAQWLAVTVADGQPMWTVSSSAFVDFLMIEVAPVVERPPRDAVFEMDSSGKVTRFQSSLLGQRHEVSSTVRALDAAMLALWQATSTVAVVVETIAPAVTTAEANTLGIRDLLGVGISNFSGSPANRRKNIAAAVKKLNGTLIAPGEEFSTLRSTGPFTTTSGYLPELVIKGDALTPEIGGGLCQIGTTLFRMAMNSGLSITKRQNHSLAVGYYGDPATGNPGTDATVYDPAPDFRFKNDTADYALLETDMNVAKGILTFRLWGTADGRQGSYSQPVVKRWIPPGDSKTIETVHLPVGEENCQKAFRGAEASFTYTRALPDGTEEKRTFDSFYRPLPQICLIGAAGTASTTIDIREFSPGV